MPNNQVKNKQASVKKRDREKTHANIRQAIVRIEQGRPKKVSVGRKLSVASVAEEADVSTTLIHNQYPDLKARILGYQDKYIQSQRDDIRSKYQAEREKNRINRERIREISQKNAVLASKLATCILEIEQLKAINKSYNLINLRS